MNKLFVRVSFLLLVIFSETFSEIISGTNTLLFNENITFSTHSITQNSFDASLHLRNGCYVYTCAADMEAIDVFNAVKINGVCIYTCFISAIGSPRPFYLSKIPFESFDFVNELNLTDTSKYMKIDTIAKDSMLTNSPTCFLPHVILDAEDYSESKKYKTVDFGIFNNSDGNFILVKFDTVMDLSADRKPEPEMHPYLKGYKIEWYLQSDGSLRFANITHVFRQPVKTNKFSIKMDKNSVFYDIFGRRIIINNKGASQILIRKNTNGAVNKQFSTNLIY